MNVSHLPEFRKLSHRRLQLRKTSSRCISCCWPENDPRGSSRFVVPSCTHTLLLCKVEPLQFDLAQRGSMNPCAVIISDRWEIEIIHRTARTWSKSSCGERMSMSRLCQRLEALVGLQAGAQLHLFRIVKDSSRYGAAEIDVEAGPVTLAVRDREAGEALIDAAPHFAALERPFSGFVCHSAPR